MKIAVPADALRAALSRAAQVADRKMIVPVLSSVHVEASDAGVKLTATDMDVTLVVTVEGAVVHEPGVTCLPAAELLRLATLARKATMEIRPGAGFSTAAVSWGRTQAELRTYDPADFPMPKRDGYALAAVDGALVAAAIRYAMPAVDDSEARPYLRGVYLADDDGEAVAVATDGHRMHCAMMPGVTFGGGAIIPQKSAQLIADALAGASDAKLHISAERWGVEAGGVLAWGRNVDGSFPAWRRVLMGEPVEVALIQRDTLREAVEIAQAGSDKEGHGPVVVLDAAGGEITVRGFKPGASLAKAASTTVECEGRAPMLAALNGDYLRDMLAATACERVVILSAGERVEIEPVEQKTMLRLRAVCMVIRANAAEMGRAA